MEIHTVPFKHVIYKDTQLTDLCRVIYSTAIPIPYSEKLKNHTLTGDEQHHWWTGNHLASEETEFILLVLDKIACDAFATIYKNTPGTWNFALNESNRSSTAPVLWPHTDDPDELMSEGVHNPGILRFILYLGDENVTYENYGTKLYSEIDKHMNQYKVEKEIPFVLGTLFMWQPGPTTLHGTDFSSGTTHRRLFISGEYVKE